MSSPSVKIDPKEINNSLLNLGDQLMNMSLEKHKQMNIPIPKPKGGKTVEQLRKICKERGLKGYSRMNKPELLRLLKQNGSGTVTPISTSNVSPQSKKKHNKKPPVLVTDKSTIELRKLDSKTLVDDTTGFVFISNAQGKLFEAIGRINNSDNTVIPLSCIDIDECKEKGILYRLPLALKTQMKFAKLEELDENDLDEYERKYIIGDDDIDDDVEDVDGADDPVPDWSAVVD